ncbi:MAG: hypothetical protein OEZ68_15230 [Gammaproteobacteria bacterium]|nr:hypothetical protein [Gammaproteobacteria bacterium]MDH5802153.1 hypothetical protein [Gammaproteobacteria bacterium]
MKLSFFLSLTLLVFVSCTRTEKGLVFGIPSYEKRHVQVSNMDLEILEKAKYILKDKDHWTNDKARTCTGQPPFNLYCVLEKASIDIDGIYIHRRPALQEVRFTIDDKFKERWRVHRLADFNGHPGTTYEDVIGVLDESIGRIKHKLSSYSTRDSKK